MMPVPVIPAGGKVPVAIIFVLGVLAVSVLVKRAVANTQPQR